MRQSVYEKKQQHGQADHRRGCGRRLHHQGPGKRNQGPLRSRALRELALLDLANNPDADISRSLASKGSSLWTFPIMTSPILAYTKTVPALQYIKVIHNKVKDLRPLAELKNMSALYLGYNQIEYIYPILGLPKLASLHLSVNRITSIEGIGQLKWLSSLSLDGNQIYDLATLDGHQNLNFLFLEYNQIQDISPLISMARSDQEGERRFAPFLKLYLKGNRVRKSQIEKLKEYGVRIQY